VDLKEYLTGNLDDAHRMLGIALEDLTDEIVHRQPGGTANTIAQILVHVVMGEDNLINRTVKEGDSIFIRDGWAAKTGSRMRPAASGIKRTGG
jgi:uncharacterized damage-inducible protein DinB